MKKKRALGITDSRGVSLDNEAEDPKGATSWTPALGQG